MYYVHAVSHPITYASYCAIGTYNPRILRFHAGIGILGGRGGGGGGERTLCSSAMLLKHIHWIHFLGEEQQLFHIGSLQRPLL